MYSSRHTRLKVAGKRVVLVDPRNTSQQCSHCDGIVKKTLAARIHRCPSCGFECDRDINAAKNILKRALQQLQSVSKRHPGCKSNNL